MQIAMSYLIQIETRLVLILVYSSLGIQDCWCLYEGTDGM